MSRILAITAALILVLVSLPAAGQDVTGDLEGWIQDRESGEPIGFANVTVSGEYLQGNRGTISGSDGFFRVLGLPVGNYTVTIQHISYQLVSYDEVRVRLGTTTSLGSTALASTSLQMEEVVVTGHKPLLDFSSADLGDNLNAELLDQLPTPRDYREVVAYVPQANTSYLGDGTNIGGSTGSENQYFIEGVNVTDPFLASSGTRLPQNFVREVQIKKGGYEAEYGKASGGIINVITHSGSNELHGQVFGYFTNNNFASDSRRGLAELRQDSFSRYDLGASVGGAILRDKLWYFAAYNPTFEAESLQIPGHSFFDDTSVSHLFATKLSWRAEEDTSFDLSIFGDPGNRDGVGGDVLITTLGTIANPDPLLSERTTGAFTANLSGQHLFGERAILRGSISRVESNDKKGPSTEVGRNEPTYLNEFEDTLSGGNQNRFDHHAVRWAGDLSTTVFLGDHELKLGGSYENIQLDEEWLVQTPDGRDGIVWRLDTDIWLATTLLNEFEVSHRLPSVYLQDSWRITDRLRLNGGLRWDGIYVVDPEGDVALSINDGYQPRFGANYQLDEQGNNKISGSYGRFYEQIPMIAASWYYGAFYQTVDFYDENPISNPSATPTGSVLYDDSTFTPDTDIEGQYLDEFTLGYERRFRNTWRFGVRGVYREIGQVIEDAIDPVTFESYFGNPGRGLLSYLPEGTRQYKALEFTLQNTFGRQLHLSSSYVLSESYGNYPGAYDTDGDNPHAHVTSSFWDPLQISEGKLPNDRTHVFKAYGTYGFDFGLTTGAFFTVQSGTPLSEYGGTFIGPNAYSHLVPRGTAGRTPTIWDANLRFAYELSRLSPNFGRAHPRLLVDIFHLFSQREVVDVDQVHYAILDDMGNQAGLNPNWRKPVAYQPPMTIRVGIESSF
jgi:hypothetical protein